MLLALAGVSVGVLDCVVVAGVVLGSVEVAGLSVLEGIVLETLRGFWVVGVDCAPGVFGVPVTAGLTVEGLLGVAVVFAAVFERKEAAIVTAAIEGGLPESALKSCKQ